MKELERFKNTKLIFVVGIGGSNLASKAVWEAVTLHKPNLGKRLVYLEAPDLREYEEAQALVGATGSPEDVAIFVISKSGATEETLAAFHKIFDIVSERFGRPANDRVITISSPNTLLSKLAEERGFTKLEWEGDIGGRWSAFTVAHTAVLEVAGLDTEKFKEGSHSASPDSRASRDEQEKLARAIFESYKKGADVLDFFFFNDELETLGKWARQLIAESLATLTPTVSIGPTDLHSMLELYLEKPGSRFTIFVHSKSELGNVNEQAYQNTTEEFAKRNMPFYKYEMPEINEFEVGKFMAFCMELTLALAKLLDLNPYDQPEVEKYKSEVRNPK